MLGKLLACNHNKHHNRHHHTGREKVLHKLGKKLKLDTQQQARLSSLQSTWMKARAEIEQVRTDRNEMLEAMLYSPTLDQEDTQQLIRIPHLALDEHLPDMVESFRLFHASLNDDQRVQLVSFWQKYQQYSHCSCH